MYSIHLSWHLDRSVFTNIEHHNGVMDAISFVLIPILSIFVDDVKIEGSLHISLAVQIHAEIGGRVNMEWVRHSGTDMAILHFLRLLLLFRKSLCHWHPFHCEAVVCAKLLSKFMLASILAKYLFQRFRIQFRAPITSQQPYYKLYACRCVQVAKRKCHFSIVLTMRRYNHNFDE